MRAAFASVFGPMVLACAVLVGTPGQAWAAQRLFRQPMPEFPEAQRLDQLFHEISTINLLNGIRLTRQQTEQILALARQAQALRTSSPHTEYYRKALREVAEAYEAFKAEAMKGEPPGEQASRRAVRQEFRVSGIRDRHARLIEQRITEFDAKLKKILTEGQVQIVETFKPCLVPPQDLKDPVRAGQAAGDRFVEMLDRLRGMGRSDWNAHKDRIAEMHVRRVEGLNLEIVKPEAREAQKRRVLEIVEKARAMSDVEFGMEKAQLAAQLSPDESRKALFESSRVVRGKGRPHADSACVRWLLHADVIPILEERLKAGIPFSAAPGAAGGAPCPE